MRRAADLPFLLSEGTRVAFVPPVTDMPRQARVESVDLIDDATALVYFDCVDNKNDASLLVGSHCLIRTADIPRESFAQAPQTWAGWEVVDERFGLLGTVHDIEENPAQLLLEVERASEPERGYLLIPVVDEFVVDVDVDARRVRTAVPDGLLEL